jgi:hypothetical protein
MLFLSSSRAYIRIFVGLLKRRSETELIMRTLRDMNISKFVAEDVPLFLDLIEDLFPKQRADRAPAADVASALAKVCTERGLQPHPAWMQRCLQLYDTTLVRHGVMVVGPSGTGKTTAVECLVGLRCGRLFASALANFFSKNSRGLCVVYLLLCFCQFFI